MIDCIEHAINHIPYDVMGLKNTSNNMSLLNLQTIANLVTLYNEPHRCYHNLNHIYDCLSKLEDNKQTLKLHDDQYDVIEAAIWFHDAVYNPRSKYNEYNSSQLVYGCINNYHTEIEIINCIMATKHHEPKSYKEKIICDIDLSILGGSPEEYEKYSNNIRKEYDFVPIQLYKTKRAEVLQSFLDKTKIFHTKHFHSLYENKARKNIDLELKELCF